jgi:hypothetical protein
MKIRWTITGVMDDNGKSAEQERADFVNGEYEYDDLVGVSADVEIKFQEEL